MCWSIILWIQTIPTIASKCRYQLTPHVKLKDIQGLYSYYGAISSYSDKQSLVLWSLLNVNNDYILMDDLYRLLPALFLMVALWFVIEGVTLIVSLTAWTMGRSVQSFLLWTAAMMFCNYALHSYRPVLSTWLLQRLCNDMHPCLLTPYSGSIASLLIQLWMLWSIMSWLYGYYMVRCSYYWLRGDKWSLHNLIVTLFHHEHHSVGQLSLWLSLAIQAAAPPTVILAFVGMGSLILAPIPSVSLVWIQLPSLAILFWVEFKHAWVVHCLTLWAMQLMLWLNLLLVSHLLSWSKWVSGPMRNNPSSWCWCASLSYWLCVRAIPLHKMEYWLPIHSRSSIWIQVRMKGTILHQLLHLSLLLLLHLPIPLLIMQQLETVILCQAWVVFGADCVVTSLAIEREAVLSLWLQTKSHFWSTKICAMMFVKHFQVLPPLLIPLRVP